jgi:predicted  nucleic acid-binding Zn-ribbon protein
MEASRRERVCAPGAPQTTMNADLEHLIRLQALDLELQALQRTIDSEADRQRDLEAGLESQRTALAEARERLTTIQQARRLIEKDLAQVQTRLSRYRDQLMAVKTNKEYHAMQSEISTAEAEVRRFEDQILEGMVEADDLHALVRAAEQALAKAETDTRTGVQTLAAETAAARQRLGQAAAARQDVASSMAGPLLALFEHIARNRGTVVVQAVDGHCSVCHVRIRPKVYQDVRRNDMIIQCDSCQRILYYALPVTPAGTAPPQ